MYITRNLVKVTKRYGKPEYFGVSDETLQNMQDSSSAAQYMVCDGDAKRYAAAQFEVEDMGEIKVEVTEDGKPVSE